MASLDGITWYANTFDYNWGKYVRILDYGGSQGKLYL